MSLDARLNKLAPMLTARERATLVLGSMKAATPEDRSWRSTMPTTQVQEFNRLIDVMNRCNCEVGAFILLLAKSVEVLERRESWLFTMASGN